MENYFEENPGEVCLLSARQVIEILQTVFEKEEIPTAVLLEGADQSGPGQPWNILDEPCFDLQQRAFEGEPDGGRDHEAV